MALLAFFILLLAWTGPQVEYPRLSRQSAHEGGKVVSLCLQEIFLILIAVRLSRTQEYSAAVIIKAMKITNDPVGDRNRDLSACSAMLQPKAPPRTHHSK